MSDPSGQARGTAGPRTGVAHAMICEVESCGQLATGINSQGDVVGRRVSPDFEQAMVFPRGGNPAILGAQTAEDINNAGVIAGRAPSSVWPSNATLWTTRGTIQAPSPSTTVPWSSRGSAAGVRFGSDEGNAACLVEGATAQQSPAKAPQWAPEQGVSVAQRDSTIELKASRGWIRLNSVFSDFVLEFEFQLATKSSSGSVSIRSRPGYDRTDFPFYGYDLILSDADDFGRVQVLGVTSVHANASVKAASRAVGEWQHARIEAEASVLRITLNDAPPLTLEELDEYAGYVALHAERGRVAFRNIRITRIPPHEQQFESGILRESVPGVRLPKLVREVKPFYPKEPHDAWIVGSGNSGHLFPEILATSSS